MSKTNARQAPRQSAPAASAPAQAPAELTPATDTIADGLQEPAADQAGAPAAEDSITGGAGEDSPAGATENTESAPETTADPDAPAAPTAPAADAPAPAATDEVKDQIDAALADPAVQTAMSEKIECVIANVPKAYRLTLDSGTVIPVAAGVQNMPRAYVEHWWSKANGVTEFNPEAAEK